MTDTCKATLEGEPHGKPRLGRSLALPGSAILLLVTTGARAAPTQEDVFRSIQDNVGESTDPRKVLAFLVGAVAIVILLVVFSQWRKRERTPKALNHQGKLLRELSAAVSLKPAEIKQLKLLADEQTVSNPMTLILCPSLLAQAVKNAPAKVDRRVIIQIAKKLS